MFETFDNLDWRYLYKEMLFVIQLYTPLKIKMEPKITQLKRKIIFQTSIFGFKLLVFGGICTSKWCWSLAVALTSKLRCVPGDSQADPHVKESMNYGNDPEDQIFCDYFHKDIHIYMYYIQYSTCTVYIFCFFAYMHTCSMCEPQSQSSLCIQTKYSDKVPGKPVFRIDCATVGAHRLKQNLRVGPLVEEVYDPPTLKSHELLCFFHMLWIVMV